MKGNWNDNEIKEVLVACAKEEISLQISHSKADISKKKKKEHDISDHHHLSGSG